ncbi:hypothetical protein BVG79_01100 [Ketogulonicigenium robustum]|uniref:Uncharacterized protein n=1 Tax=Ketogulonicigenium robustum TaxID=92947 RepID=A0A1W6NYV9_9RHOB|nr:hypothetical protein [Ketogulonicigenium robustum]ARO14446.1 hypothetical protein BVG79_01100 [Ketogulonicigenium robustum]
MRLQFDFVAPTGTHFGKVQSLEEVLASISAPVDRWEDTPSSLTLVDGRVSEWAGLINGRTLTQANANFRPPYADGVVQFGNPATGAAAAAMGLTGAAIGQQEKLTLALRLKLLPDQLLTDNQGIVSCQTAPQQRLTYRYTGGAKQVRTSFAGVSPFVASPLDLANDGSIGMVVVYNGLRCTAHMPGADPVSVEMPALTNWSEFYVGSISNLNNPSLRGSISRIGLWQSTPTDDQLAALMNWVA